MFLQDNGSLTALFGKANDWRNREHVVLDLFSNLNRGNIQWLLSVNLWGQVITLRGLFFVSCPLWRLDMPEEMQLELVAMLHTVPSATAVRCCFICSRECCPNNVHNVFHA